MRTDKIYRQGLSAANHDDPQGARGPHFVDRRANRSHTDPGMKVRSTERVGQSRQCGLDGSDFSGAALFYGGEEALGQFDLHVTACPAYRERSRPLGSRP